MFSFVGCPFLDKGNYELFNKFEQGRETRYVEREKFLAHKPHFKHRFNKL